jgi:hypothetical protein
MYDADAAAARGAVIPRAVAQVAPTRAPSAAAWPRLPQHALRILPAAPAGPDSPRVDALASARLALASRELQPWAGVTPPPSRPPYLPAQRPLSNSRNSRRLRVAGGTAPAPAWLTWYFK